MKGYLAYLSYLKYNFSPVLNNIGQDSNSTPHYLGHVSLKGAQA
jgi:hypothetical protein